MLKGRIAVASLLACGTLGVAGTTVVHAAGETVKATAKVSPSKPKINKKGTPVPVKLAFGITITAAAGTREGELKTLEVKFPKGLTFDVKRFKTCPLATLKANKPETCPAGSQIAGDHATLNGTPLFKDLLHSTGHMFVTRKTATGFDWGLYSTVNEIKTLHGVVEGSMKMRGGVITFRSNPPQLPTAPGLPNGTTQAVDYLFAERGSDGRPLLRATKTCSGAWKLPMTVAFYNAPSLSASAKAAC